ncbi:MAG: hypothetical protein J6I85_07070 [Clostridia bacterium]|nr:hypothetical protein [Clostridia bacterium]MBP3801761.1 hypothetical protein [Clostridia bacterium]
MTEVIMSNTREKLSKARKMCPGLGFELYSLTHYMSQMVNDEITPAGLAMTLVLCLDDIQRERCGFASAKSKELDSYLIKNKAQILAQAVYVPQVVDAIADEEFAIEFREICKEMLQFDPPKRIENYNLKADIEGDYPENIKIASNWWAHVLMNPIFKNGDDIADMAGLLVMIVNSKSAITQEQITTFKVALADEITNALKSSRNGEIYVSVDYHPDIVLATAAEKAGIDDDMGFPWKTTMKISNESIAVSVGYAAPWKVLWEKIA